MVVTGGGGSYGKPYHHWIRVSHRPWAWAHRAEVARCRSLQFQPGAVAIVVMGA